MGKNIQEILESISTDILSDNVKKEITEAFNKAVNDAVNSRLELEVNNALIKMDEEHCEKLENLINAIDEDHTKKLKIVVEQIDKDHTKKLRKIINKYENELKKGAERLKNELIDKLDRYLTIYLNKVIPEKDLKEAIENIRAKKIVDQIKELVSLDEDYVSETIKEALIDGKHQIDKLRSDLNKQIKEKIELEQKLNKIQAQLLLERKTRGFSNSKKEFIFKLLENKTPKEIEENFSYVVEMFEKDEESKKEIIKEKAMKNGSVLSASIVQPKSNVLDNNIQPNNNVFDDYYDDDVKSIVENLKKLDQKI